MPIDYSIRTLYRHFKEKVFDETALPMEGKRKPNGHQGRRGNQAFKRNISERESDFKEKFGPIESHHYFEARGAEGKRYRKDRLPKKWASIK